MQQGMDYMSNSILEQFRFIHFYSHKQLQVYINNHYRFVCVFNKNDFGIIADILKFIPHS